jgi:hypothetical protein
LRRYELFGKTAGYVWDLFYNIGGISWNQIK